MHGNDQEIKGCSTILEFSQKGNLGMTIFPLSQKGVGWKIPVKQCFEKATSQDSSYDDFLEIKITQSF